MEVSGALILRGWEMQCNTVLLIGARSAQLRSGPYQVRARVLPVDQEDQVTSHALNRSCWPGSPNLVDLKILLSSTVVVRLEILLNSRT